MLEHVLEVPFFRCVVISDGFGGLLQLWTSETTVYSLSLSLPFMNNE